MNKFMFDKGEIPFRSEKIRIYSGFLYYYPLAKVMLTEKRLVILINESEKKSSWDRKGNPILQEATLNEFLSKIIKDKDEQVLSIDYADIISVKLKRANPFISFLLWNWFRYIHLIYRDEGGKIQKVRFYCYKKLSSRFWRVDNGATKRVFADVRERAKK